MNASLRTDDVMRYQDARFKTIAAKLLPTQYLVVDDTTALTTTLGSCVAACLRDPVLKIGGMNHFLLPEGNAGDGAPARYGSYAMELLINDMLKRGAHRKRIEAKVFGGGGEAAGFHDLAKQAHVFEGVHCRFSVDAGLFYSRYVPAPQIQCGSWLACDSGGSVDIGFD